MTAFEKYHDAVTHLQGAERPLFVLLENIDADAIGSAVALARSLLLSGKQPRLFSRGRAPMALRFLLDGRIPFEEEAEHFPSSGYDALIIGDVGHPARTGFASEIEAARQRGVPVINIDHHHVHEDFGSINVVDEKASATAEITYDLIKLGDWPMDADVATALLTGIIADTGNFTNAGTTMRSLEIAANCYARGADVRRVTRELFQGRDVNALKLWGTILSRLRKKERWGLVTTVILLDDFEAFDISEEATEGLANFMNTISDMKAALILKELPTGEVRGSLRTTRDDVDVSKLAKFMGGGGHKKAAGFTVPGKIVARDGGWQIVPAERQQELQAAA